MKKIIYAILVAVALLAVSCNKPAPKATLTGTTWSGKSQGVTTTIYFDSDVICTFTVGSWGSSQLDYTYNAPNITIMPPAASSAQPMVGTVTETTMTLNDGEQTLVFTKVVKE